MLNQKRTPTTSMSRDERGASLVEYALLVALIAVVAISAVGALGTKVSGQYTKVSNALK
jgi:pilus assembly protein Flp/PilA